MREQPSGAVALWRAEARLRQDRRRALAELERCFASGSSPGWLDGPLDGRLVTTTLGSGLDVAVEAATRLWMPWAGKAFAPERAEGRNRFVAAARPVLRVVWPGYHDLLPDGSSGFTAFRFDTGIGESATARGLEVLRLDYDHPTSPWPVRLIVDELVEVGGGQLLGQALMGWNGRYRRVAWFALQPPG